MSRSMSGETSRSVRSEKSRNHVESIDGRETESSERL